MAIEVTKEGTAPTFEFWCPVCGEEFNVTGYEGDVKIMQHPLPHQEAKTFYFSAETRCQCCGYLVRSKRIVREITFAERQYLIRTEELPDEYWQWTCENFEQKSKRTNREVLNAMTNEQLAKFMNHIGCSMCAYYNDPDTEPDCVCAKQHERMNDPEAGSRICIDGLAEWLGQEEAWWMKEEEGGGRP